MSVCLCVFACVCVCVSGFIYENSTGDLRFVYSGLTPYTRYRVAVRAKSAGLLGPEAFTAVLTPAEGKNTHTNMCLE